MSQGGRPPGLAPPSSSSHDPRRGLLGTGLQVAALPSPAVVMPNWGPASDPHRREGRTVRVPLSPCGARRRLGGAARGARDSESGKRARILPGGSQGRWRP